VIKAWRKAVLLHHPDKQASNQASSNTSSSSVDIRLINEAKWILSDEKRRRDWEEVYLAAGMSIVHNDWRLTNR
jgi:curved DNA-binding protein CbpA